HCDRGLAVANSLAALAAGAECVHATALGIGERVGNTQMDQMLVNLKLMGVPPWDKQDLTRLKDYCQAVSGASGVPIPRNYPVFDRGGGLGVLRYCGGLLIFIFTSLASLGMFKKAFLVSARWMIAAHWPPLFSQKTISPPRICAASSG